MKRSPMLWSAVVTLTFMLAAGHAVAQSINYNASKSNTGNLTAPKSTDQGKQKPGMAVKGSGVPKNSSKVNNTTTRSNTQHN